jgi:lipid II:glycine glycyltransferase (peptidoglycan interpeptide bridge formation enzyme)
MQSYAWGQLQAAAGWQPHYLTLRDGERIAASALLLSRSIPLTGTKLFQAPRGPVVDSSAGPGVTEALTMELKRYVREQRGAFVRADPYAMEGDELSETMAKGGFEAVPRDWSYWNGPKFVFWLDLDGDEEAVLKRTTANCQRDIRAGYRKGVEFRIGTAAELDDFHRLMVAMSTTKGIAVHDLGYYRRVYETLGSSATVGLFSAHFEGAIVAAGMSVIYGARAWLLYAASDRAYSRLGVNRNVQWEMIKWAHRAGCRRYDFRGTATGDPPDPNDPGYGVYQFKKSFGPRFVRLAGYYDLVTITPVHRLFRFAEERVLPRAYRAKVWLDERRART